MCHAENGSAEFDGSVNQSRATLSPLSLSEGTDHAPDIRENMPVAAGSYNRLIHKGTIDRADGTRIPSRPCASGDLQAIKAAAAQEERTHSPWCMDCHESPERQHAYGTANFRVQTYEEMIKYIDQVVQCKMRSEEWMCQQLHMSFGTHVGHTEDRARGGGHNKVIT